MILLVILPMKNLERAYYLVFCSKKIGCLNSNALKITKIQIIRLRKKKVHVVVVPIYLLNCVVTEVISPVSSNISENKIR
jgi:hypothetical protein